jgi:hypothetical protein
MNTNEITTIFFKSYMLSANCRTILDADTRVPLIGVSIVIAGSDPLIGTVSDAAGDFHFYDLPVGRYDLEVYYWVMSLRL